MTDTVGGRPVGTGTRTGELTPPTAPADRAALLAPLLELLLGEPLPVRFELWDGSAVGPGPEDGPGTIVVRSPDALRRILWSPGELGLARAYVAGDLDLRGDLFGVLRALERAVRHDLQATVRAKARDVRPGLRTAAAALRPTLEAGGRALGAARRLGAIGLPPQRPAIEAAPRGRIHSKIRDSQAISHHYDISNDFYRMVLGPSMTYSCARFDEDVTTLEDAQASKHELICRKLGLDTRPGARLLDVGCGWASMALHAARHHGARVVGVTLSAAQAEAARQRVREAGCEDRVDIRLQDYRDLHGERFDVISSVGMSEHVGRSEIGAYFATLHGLLGDSGRLLNHAISSVGGSRMGRRSFIGRYVFPDGELIDVGEVVLAMEQAGFEVRDVESLREHYARTLHAWVDNLEARWDEAVAEVGIERARVWRLYMAVSANAFEAGGIAIHQVLGVASGADGQSHMPPTRSAWS